MRKGSGGRKEVSHLALGRTNLSDTTPTCEQNASRIVTDGVQKLQHVKSATSNVEPTTWFTRGHQSHVLVRVLGQIGLVESGIPDLPIGSIHLVGGYRYPDINNRRVK